MNTSSDNHVERDDRLFGHILGDGPTAFSVLVIGNVNLYPPDDAADWLRRLAVTAEELAEQVELAARPGLALAEQHIAEAKAAAGIGATS